MQFYFLFYFIFFFFPDLCYFNPSGFVLLTSLHPYTYILATPHFYSPSTISDPLVVSFFFLLLFFSLTPLSSRFWTPITNHQYSLSTTTPHCYVSLFRHMFSSFFWSCPPVLLFYVVSVVIVCDILDFYFICFLLTL